MPGRADRAEADRIIFDELTLRLVRDELARDVRRHHRRGCATPGAEAVVLGCTEIELLVRPEDAPLPVLDSMRTHAEAAVAAALGDRVLAEV